MSMKRLLSVVALSVALSPVAAHSFGKSDGGVQWNPSNPSSSAPADPTAAPQPPANITGRVEQVIDSGGYTYALVKKKNNESVWVAVPQAKVQTGEEYTFEGGMEMVNFPSSTLKRTFDKVVFSNGIVKGTESKGKDAKKDSRSPGSTGAAVAVTSEKVKVTKATGANAYTIKEIFKKMSKLKNKQVVLNAKVVKVSSGIMNTNWVHLQDGTGNHATSDNDLVVTSDTIPLVGDVVTVKGKLQTNKDFGGGYKYKVIIEKAIIEVK